MIRFFCQVEDSDVGDRSFDYLQLVSELGYRVRALPIGAASAWFNDAKRQGRWLRLRHLFTQPMSSPFVNIVCSPLGPKTGQSPGFFGLCTIDCQNVAIVTSCESPEKADSEILALMRYDLVICTLASDRDELRERGVTHAVIAGPSEAGMRPILSMLCGEAPLPDPRDFESDSIPTLQLRAVPAQISNQTDDGRWHRLCRWIARLLRFSK